MSGDGVTVAEIVEHAYRCGAVQVTNAHDPDGEVVEYWTMVDGAPAITATEHGRGACPTDSMEIAFPTGTQVSVRLRWGRVASISAKSAPGHLNGVWRDTRAWREAIANAGALT